MRFSANLGFLFTELPLPEAIRAAAEAGFDAVECHFPFDTPPRDVRRALDATGLPMLGLNTWPGDRSAGDFGLAALPGRETDAREAIDQAIDYAAEIGAGAVHVMAGRTGGASAAEAVFRENLAYACDRAAGLTILIEPINLRDAPGYHLSRTAHAAEILAALGRDNLRIMFDCYHVQVTEGDLLRRFEALEGLVGHVQFAGVPDRAEPDRGEVHYRWLLPRMAEAGWNHPFGAEYRPAGGTREGLGWLRDWRTAAG